MKQKPNKVSPDGRYWVTKYALASGVFVVGPAEKRCWSGTTSKPPRSKRRRSAPR